VRRRKTDADVVVSSQDTAYFPPVELRDIRIEVASGVRRAQAGALGCTLPIERTGQRRWSTLPRLQAYEVLVLE
jgi:hypothetical protein